MGAQKCRGQSRQVALGQFKLSLLVVFVFLDRVRRDGSRQAATDLDIFEHPYVRRLEAEVEKWQEKYEDQVGRTQEVLESSNRNLMELHRTTTVANSKTLADYLLQAGRFLKSPFASEEGEPDTTEEAPH